MLAHRIIPCLDVHAGRVVKGVNFLNLRDAGDPVEIAKKYEEQGADELVFLDITASHESRAITYDMVRRVAEECFMPFTVGGGIRTLEDVTKLVQAGAEKVSINTAAVMDPCIVGLVAARFGSCATVVNVDPKRVGAEGFEARRKEREMKGLFAPQPELQAGGGEVFEVHTHGGRKPTGLCAVAYAKKVVELGAGELIVTSMDADGTKDGYDLPITRAISTAVTVPVIASGGCGSPAHMVAAIQGGKADAVLAASIFHYGQYTIGQAKAALRAAGLPVRI